MERVLLAVLLLSLFTLHCVGAQEAFSGPYHLVITPKKRIKATLTSTYEAPALIAENWILFAARPPRLPGQPNISASMSFGAMDAFEASPLNRPIFEAIVSAGANGLQKKITVQLQFQGTLSARHLVAGEPPAPVPPLLNSVRQNALMPTPTMDCNAAEFLRWLDEKKLRKMERETAIAFAHRAYLYIVKNYSYQYIATQDRRASLICTADKTDCGGLAFLYTAILRANGVPAHALVGRWAYTSKGTSDYGMTHVKTEFYAAGVGWIPVDPASGLSAKDDPDRFFGQDTGDHLVFHTDTDLIFDTKFFGQQTVPWTQGVLHWVTGSGSTENPVESETWQVEETPLAPAKSQ